MPYDPNYGPVQGMQELDAQNQATRPYDPGGASSYDPTGQGGGANGVWDYGAQQAARAARKQAAANPKAQQLQDMLDASMVNRGTSGYIRDPLIRQSVFMSKNFDNANDAHAWRAAGADYNNYKQFQNGGAAQQETVPPQTPPTPQTAGTTTAPPPTSTGLDAAADLPPPPPGGVSKQMSPAESAAAKSGNSMQQYGGMNPDQTVKIEVEAMQPQRQTQQLPPPTGGMTAQAPYPQPQPPVTSGGPNSPWGANPAPVAPATPPTNPQGPNMGGGGAEMGNADPWRKGKPGEDNFYGPQQIAGATPSPADYQSVQGYADQANANARRYLDPQQQMQNDRLQQELINKGVDPNSPQGQTMAKQLAMQQADANNAASFGALGFGQGIQNQMSQQQLANQGLAANMQNNLWNYELGGNQQELQRYLGDQQNQLGRYLGDQSNALSRSGMDLQRYGMDQNFNLGKGQQDLSRYGMDMGNQLAQGQLDMNRQGQNFNQMMGLEGVDFRNRAYNDSRGDYRDQMTMAMMGQTPVPGVSQVGNYGNQFRDPGDQAMLAPLQFGMMGV